MNRVREGGLDLVALDAIHPHEFADAARRERILSRLRADGILRDPLMVGSVPQFDGFVLLDGTNRLEALKSLELAWGLVQIVDYSETSSVTLRTWCHRADIPFANIVERAKAIPGIALEPIAELGASDALAAHGTVAVVLSHDQIAALSRASEYPHSRAEQLRALVDLYEARMTRVDCDPANVEELAQTLCEPAGDAATLIAFPAITRSQVATMAMRRALIPAGITRHVIMEGRVLRVNLPLEMLRGTSSLFDAREELAKHLAALQPRLYREPTILYDS